MVLEKVRVLVVGKTVAVREDRTEP